MSEPLELEPAQAVIENAEPLDLEAVMAEFHDAYYLDFERLVHPRHTRRDMHAFLLLAELVPGDRPMIMGARHDEIYLEIDCEKLARVISRDQVLELVRCGMRFDEDALCLYV